MAHKSGKGQVEPYFKGRINNDRGNYLKPVGYYHRCGPRKIINNSYKINKSSYNSGLLKLKKYQQIFWDIIKGYNKITDALLQLQFSLLWLENSTVSL